MHKSFERSFSLHNIQKKSNTLWYLYPSTTISLKPQPKLVFYNHNQRTVKQWNIRSSISVITISQLKNAGCAAVKLKFCQSSLLDSPHKNNIALSQTETLLLLVDIIFTSLLLHPWLYCMLELASRAQHFYYSAPKQDASFCVVQHSTNYALLRALRTPPTSEGKLKN